MINDWRDERGKRHRLVDILIMSIYGTLWGYTDFTNMCKELCYHEKYFKELLGLENGIPSHDCFSLVFRMMSADVFLDKFVTWLNELFTTRGKHVAIDGKAVRAASEKSHGENPLYILNAFLVDEKILCGQMRIEEKKNEISTIPQFLDYLDIEDAIITIDAIGAQYKIADKIVSKHGSYILPVKHNQPTIQSLIEGYFECLDETSCDSFESTSSLIKDHDRVKIRSAKYSEDVSCLSDMPEWASVRAIGLIKRSRTILQDKKNKDGKIANADIGSEETVCYIMSDRFGAEQFATYVRNHWQIEIFHYQLNMFYQEDKSTANKNYAIENLSLLRKIVFNMTKIDSSVLKETTKGKHIYYSHHPEAIENLIFNIIPSQWDKARA